MLNHQKVNCTNQRLTSHATHENAGKHFLSSESENINLGYASLEVFKATLGRTWKNLVYWKVLLPVVRVWKWMVLKAPPCTKHSGIP